MKARAASRSAAIIAAHRALESEKPPPERVCYDPYAAKLVGPNVTVIGETDMPKDQALALFRQFVPGFHEYFLARTRTIDDALDRAIGEGLAQLVILGAGYDSRAYRFEKLKQGIPVFEVDHPATQAVKKERIETILGHLPAHVTFVPLDLATDDLAGCLAGSGYKKHLKTLFIWEGVTMYLNPATVDQVLAVVAGGSGPGSSVIFDVTFPDVVGGTSGRPEAVAWRQKTADSGEPLEFGIDVEDLTAFLTQRGFAHVSWMGHTDLDRVCFPGRGPTVTPIMAIVAAGI